MKKNPSQVCKAAIIVMLTVLGMNLAQSHGIEESEQNADAGGILEARGLIIRDATGRPRIVLVATEFGAELKLLSNDKGRLTIKIEDRRKLPEPVEIGGVKIEETGGTATFYVGGFRDDENLYLSSSGPYISLSNPDNTLEIGSGLSWFAAAATGNGFGFGVHQVKDGGVGQRIQMMTGDEGASLRIFENHTLRSALGTLTLFDPVTEAKTVLPPSSVTLFDSSGQISFRKP